MECSSFDTNSLGFLAQDKEGSCKQNSGDFPQGRLKDFLINEFKNEICFPKWKAWLVALKISNRGRGAERTGALGSVRGAG